MSTVWRGVCRVVMVGPAPVAGLYMIHGSPAYRAERVADQPSTVRT